MKRIEPNFDIIARLERDFVRIREEEDEKRRTCLERNESLDSFLEWILARHALSLWEMKLTQVYNDLKEIEWRNNHEE